MRNLDRTYNEEGTLSLYMCYLQHIPGLKRMKLECVHILWQGPLEKRNYWNS